MVEKYLAIGVSRLEQLRAIDHPGTRGKMSGMLFDAVQGLLHRGGVHISRWPAKSRFDRDLLAALDRFAVNVVIDVGANRGQYACHLRRLGYRGRIISFEPVAEVYATLEQIAHSDEQWVTKRLALGASAGVLPIHVADNPVFSSFRQSKADAPPKFLRGLTYVSTEAVRVERLESVLRECINGIEQPAVLLKIDTQGFDLEVIEGAGESIRGIDVLQLEIPVRALYEGVPSLPAVFERLVALGFGVVSLTPVSRDDLGCVVEYDGLFQRICR